MALALQLFRNAAIAIGRVVSSQLENLCFQVGVLRRPIEDGRTPSALSQLNFRVNGGQFTSSIIDLHLPIDPPLSVVDIGGPSRSFIP